MQCNIPSVDVIDCIKIIFVILNWVSKYKINSFNTFAYDSAYLFHSHFLGPFPIREVKRSKVSVFFYFASSNIFKTSTLSFSILINCLFQLEELMLLVALFLGPPSPTSATCFNLIAGPSPKIRSIY
jgi:hypothetical protein